MTIQRAHINVNLCDSPSPKGLFGYECMIWNEVKCADFGNYLL
ncbi:penicillin-binding protein [Chryseobacterium sp. PMSZPI]|nr:penicillin-binding protein [Chryseobacterium sp. PMSZPI]PKF73603.1 penicillin-binding protein [Chryseobacterium sp. PMSZPI]